MAAIDRVDGIIMAGGRSLRFGTDKRFARLGEETLIERACRRLRSAVDGGLLISCGSVLVDFAGTDGAQTVADVPPGSGPLGGIAATLALVEFGAVVLAVDEPLVRVSTLERLAQRGRETGRPVALKSERGWEPLVAFYPRSVLNDVRAAIDQETLAPHRLLDRLDAIAMTEFDLSELVNVNTTAALARAARLREARDASPRRTK